jgi:hypothetical protein
MASLSRATKPGWRPPYCENSTPSPTASVIKHFFGAATTKMSSRMNDLHLLPAAY